MQDRIKQMLLQAGWQQWQVDNVSHEDMERIEAYTRLVAEDCARVADVTANLCSHPSEIASAIRARYAETKEG